MCNLLFLFHLFRSGWRQRTLVFYWLTRVSNLIGSIAWKTRKSIKLKISNNHFQEFQFWTSGFFFRIYKIYKFFLFLFLNKYIKIFNLLKNYSIISRARRVCILFSNCISNCFSSRVWCFLCWYFSGRCMSKNILPCKF